MTEVHVKGKSDDDFKKAMSKFKKLVSKEGVIREVKDRRYFKKKSQKQREYKNSLKRKHERTE